jgi:hypothetical protein
MNDRGLRLTPAEMLKGFLLANIPSDSQRNHCSDVWKRLEQLLLGIDKEAQADCFKAWLRAQHAQSIRERRAQAADQDFELIGREFHRWLRTTPICLAWRTRQALLPSFSVNTHSSPASIKRSARHQSSSHPALRPFTSTTAVASPCSCR